MGGANLNGCGCNLLDVEAPKRGSKPEGRHWECLDVVDIRPTCGSLVRQMTLRLPSQPYEIRCVKIPRELRELNTCRTLATSLHHSRATGEFTKLATYTSSGRRETREEMGFVKSLEGE